MTRYVREGLLYCKTRYCGGPMKRKMNALSCFLPSLVGFILIAPMSSMAQTKKDDPMARCAQSQHQDSPLYSSDFSWGIDLQQLQNLFFNIFKSGKRLPKRAYFEPQSGQIKLPFRSDLGGDVPVPPQFIENIRHHVEISLKRKYADAVIFSDMGHSHFLIPQEIYDEKYKMLPN